jgi:hypothetical protein
MSSNKQKTPVEWLIGQFYDNERMLSTGQLLQAKEMEVEQMEAASKNSEAFADGYSQGYNRALELVKWALSNLIPPHNEQK